MQNHKENEKIHDDAWKQMCNEFMKPRKLETLKCKHKDKATDSAYTSLYRNLRRYI